jgi:CRISPR-associated protein Cmr1
MDPQSADLDSDNWQWRINAAAAAQDDLLARVVDKQFISAGVFPDGVPHLSTRPERYRIRLQEHHKDPKRPWAGLVRKLKDFRQNRPGHHRSHWPEPDAVRKHSRYTGALYGHNVPVYDDPPIDSFPRAVFGLPIVFDFLKRHDPDDPDSEPLKTVLVSSLSDRFASPLIIKPLACGSYVGLATVLEGPVPWETPAKLVLRENKKDGLEFGSGLTASLTPDERRRIAAKHTLYKGNPDILQSFLNIL